MSGKLLFTGLTGTAVTGICCVTPAATFILTALGASAWAGWLDYALLPAFAGFLALMVYAVWTTHRRRRRIADHD
jgi:mercuric ion transport protein